MLIRIFETNREDVLIRVRNRRRKGRVRHWALIELIASPEHPAFGKCPVAANAGGESILPVFLNTRAGQKKSIVTNRKVQGLKPGELNPLEVSLNADRIRELHPDS